MTTPPARSQEVVGAPVLQTNSLEILAARLDRLEDENTRLRAEIEALKAEGPGEAAPGPNAGKATVENASTRFVRTDSALGQEILDQTTNINRKRRILLERKRDGTLATDSLLVHAEITAVADYQRSNRDDKFGYLMRHPTAANQIGDVVSEAAIHSAQLGITGTVGDWVTGHAVLLFEPQQSFGSGSNVNIERNQVQVRRAYALLGNLERSPFHASLGKMAVPFGLGDTVNPFSASSAAHTFSALANGMAMGYATGNLNLSLMAIQGGAQYRAANTPVKGTAVPSRLNNFAFDANHRFDMGSGAELLLGGSYLHGSAYCQDYPIVHFASCRDNNPAFDVYGKFVSGNFTLKSEFARTRDVWPGTYNPELPQFSASRVTSFDIGAKFRYDVRGDPLDVSAEFGRFLAGPDDAPWERQDQTVLGLAWYPHPNTKLLLEYVRADGFAPLNFLSGGNIRDEDGKPVGNRTHSDRSARTHVVLAGVNLAF